MKAGRGLHDGRAGAKILAKELFAKTRANSRRRERVRWAWPCHLHKFTENNRATVQRTAEHRESAVRPMAGPAETVPIPHLVASTSDHDLVDVELLAVPGRHAPPTGRWRD